MRIFLDSSSLAKRYIIEPGTDQVLGRCGQADEVVLSVLCVPEIISALNRLRRENKLSKPRYRRLKRDFAADLAQATIIDLTSSVMDRVVFCLERSSLRALDAIHVASAMEAGCDLFISADRRQCEAAAGLRLKVEIVGKPS
ncbi:MAG: type II toxin-antitoxin system VapC family toxin [Elusimicrobiota bacterium]